MALGTLTSVSQAAAEGPLFFDKFTIVGDGAYLTGGTTGLLAKLRAARGDSRAIVTCKGKGSTAGYTCEYVVATDKLQVFFEDQTSGVTAEAANAADLDGITFTCESISK
jgi:hypothetical protein